MLTLEPTELPGLWRVRSAVFADQRGEFLKGFEAADFGRQGVEFAPREYFVSRSRKDVLRGMHYQLPPHDHAKLVWCLQGRILDVVLDLRPGGFGRWYAEELALEAGVGLLIPAGCAHGFLALSESAWVSYHTTTTHQPAADTGVLWSSFGFPWPCVQPILSERDGRHPRLELCGHPFGAP